MSQLFPESHNLKPPCPTRWLEVVYILQPLVQPIRTMHEASIFTIEEVHLNGRDYSMPWGGLLQLWVITPCLGWSYQCYFLLQQSRCTVHCKEGHHCTCTRGKMLLLSLKHTCVNKTRHYFWAPPQRCHHCIRRYHWCALMMEHLNPLHSLIPKDLKYLEASDVRVFQEIKTQFVQKLWNSS